MKKNVWLDCDPGHDDCFAITLAAFHPDLELLGISTVGGNQDVGKTTFNTLAWLNIIGKRNIPVYQGQANPLILKNVNCPEIHGISGLERLSQKENHLHGKLKPQNEKAVMAMAEHINQSSEPVTIIGTARLTNIALMLSLFPETKINIKEIVIMGGALGSGNTSPVAEFNIETDPHAANIVFNSASIDYDLIMIPLEVTHQILVTNNILNQLKKLGDFGLLCEDLLLYFKSTYQKVFNFCDPPLHDPCAVFYVTNSNCIETEFLNVEIETGSQMSLGQTVVDLYNRTGKKPNVYVGRKINVEKFWEVMLSALKIASHSSVMYRK